MKGRIGLILAAAVGLLSAPAQAGTFITMFERNTDVQSNEIAFRTYASLPDLFANTPSGPDQFSPINLSSGFDSSGLTWDGSRFITMFERNTDVQSNEIAFRTYASLADMIANIPSGPDQFSAINLASGFDSSGLTWDGSQFIVMFERNTDVQSNEIAFRTYASFADLIANIPSSPDQFSSLNLASGFDSSGLTWDGGQFIVMFERNTDVQSNEIAFRTYASFADLIANIPSGPDQFSPINLAAGFDSSGLAAMWPTGGTGDVVPVPEPGTLSVLAFGFAALALASGRRRQFPHQQKRG